MITKEKNFINYETIKGVYKFDINTATLYGLRNKPIKNVPIDIKKMVEKARIYGEIKMTALNYFLCSVLEFNIGKINDSHFIVDGATLIEEVSEMIHVHLDDSENYTIGGLLMDKLGHVPAENEHAQIKIGNATFKIISMDEQSIDKIDIVVENSGEENGSTSKDTSN